MSLLEQVITAGVIASLAVAAYMILLATGMI